MSFRDHFSGRAAEYARYRPTYPEALYEYLASLAPGHGLAWDCATGSGQAAIEVAKHFRHVLATDGSTLQLEKAVPDARVSYATAYAEGVPVADHSVDLITVAAAAHWFTFDPFYEEVRRIARPGGVIAMWSYYNFESEPAIAEVMDRYADVIVHSYWPERLVKYNKPRYKTLPFPFPLIESPQFYAEAHWTMQEVLGFSSTWSATQRYYAHHGKEALDLIVDDLASAWGDPDRRVHIRWPLHMLVGRISHTDML